MIALTYCISPLTPCSPRTLCRDEDAREFEPAVRVVVVDVVVVVTRATYPITTRRT